MLNQSITYSNYSKGLNVNVEIQCSTSKLRHTLSNNNIFIYKRTIVTECCAKLVPTAPGQTHVGEKPINMVDCKQMYVTLPMIGKIDKPELDLDKPKLELFK